MEVGAGKDQRRLASGACAVCLAELRDVTTEGPTGFDFPLQSTKIMKSPGLSSLHPVTSGKSGSKGWKEAGAYVTRHLQSLSPPRPAPEASLAATFRLCIREHHTPPSRGCMPQTDRQAERSTALRGIHIQRQSFCCQKNIVDRSSKIYYAYDAYFTKHNV